MITKRNQVKCPYCKNKIDYMYWDGIKVAVNLYPSNGELARKHTCEIEDKL
jgi:RNA polymerase subunit RPABC4/transcription elongation factor Spt4